MEQTFEEKVKSMTAKEIILAMVEGLRNPAVKIDMDTFGYANSVGTCFGCAATTTVCKIAGIVFTPESIMGPANRSEAVKSDWRFLDMFETAIDSLRRGNVLSYNEYARTLGMGLINIYSRKLPVLRDDYTPEDLRAYVDLANAQK